MPSSVWNFKHIKLASELIPMHFRLYLYTSRFHHAENKIRAKMAFEKTIEADCFTGQWLGAEVHNLPPVRGFLLPVRKGSILGVTPRGGFPVKRHTLSFLSGLIDIPPI